MLNSYRLSKEIGCICHAIFLLSLIFVYVSWAHICVAQSNNNLTTAIVGADSKLSWYTNSIVGSIDGSNFQTQTLAASQFGVSGDYSINAKWSGEVNPEIGVLSKTDTTALWKILNSSNQPISFNFGDANDLFISGGDFTGDYKADAVAVAESGRALIWKIKINPFSNINSSNINNTVEEVRFGSATVKDKIFYFSLNGIQDNPAFIQKRKDGLLLRYRVPNRSKITTVSRELKRLSASERPQPIAQGDGKDAIILQTINGVTRSIYVVNTSGKILSKKRFNNVKDFVIGDFMSYAGEEIAFQNNNLTDYIIYNPFNKRTMKVVLPSGIAIDSINVNSFSQPGFPTPIATATPADPNATPIPNNGICIIQNPKDGNNGFVWKPNSDTQHFAVAVLPPVYTGTLDRCELTTTSDVLIEKLRYKGIGNGNRTNWLSEINIGSDLKNNYGSIKVKATFDDGGCVTYLITDPSVRVD